MAQGRIHRTSARSTALALASVMLGAAPSNAQQGDATARYPRQPVKFLVGFAAGGGNDLQARVVAQKLTERLGQPVVVENKPGAGGNIAAEQVARATPDGYTLLVTPAATMVINPAVYAKLPYDPIESFAPVIQVSSFQLFLTVSDTFPAKTVETLIAWAKANPDKANYASPATTFQLTAELFNLRTGVKFEHIPFKSTTEALTAVLNGQVSMAFADPGPLMTHVASGRIKPLATTGTNRWPALKDVPTMAEVGINGVESVSFTGIVAPKATPPAIVKRLETEIAAIMRMSDVIERFQALGLEVVGGTAEAFGAVIAREIPRWKEVAASAKIKLD